MIETGATPMLDDAYLEALAEEFQLLALHSCGVEFHQFLVDPAGWRAWRASAGDYEPLLPPQRAVQYRLDAEAELAEHQLMRERPDCERRGGALVEPLHHHAHVSRSPQCDFRRRRHSP